MVAHILCAPPFPFIKPPAFLPAPRASVRFRCAVLSPQVRCSFGQEGIMKKNCVLVNLLPAQETGKPSFLLWVSCTGESKPSFLSWGFCTGRGQTEFPFMGFLYRKRANRISFHGFPVQETGKPDFLYGFPVQEEGKPNFLLWVFTCKKLQNGTVFAQNGVLAEGEAILGPDMQPAAQRHGGI